MSDSISVSVTGLDRIIQGLNDVKPSIARKGQRKLQTIADKIFAQSQQEVPVDKGDLKASGKVEPYVDDADNMGMEVSYGDGNGYGDKYGIADGYAWFQELGTTKMSAQPYLGPVFEEEGQKLVTYFGNLLEDS